MKDRIAFIAGGAGGIGRACAQAFAREGARVVIADIREEEAQRVAREVDGLALRFDVRLESEVQAALSSAGDIDFAINCIGTAPTSPRQLAPAGDVDEDFWDYTINVDLRGTWLLMKHELSKMAPRKNGVIVNLASFYAFRGAPGLSPYVAAKQAVVSLSMNAALEYATEGVRVHVLCPGAVSTPVGDQLRALTRKRWRAPEKRPDLPTSRDIAEAALNLCNDRLAAISGQILVITGEQ